MNVNIMKALGIISRKENLAMGSSSPFLPVFSFYEIHESGVISAQPEEIIAAVSMLDMRGDHVVDVLLSIRVFSQYTKVSVRSVQIPF